MNTICPVCNNPVDPQAARCPACGFKLLDATQRFEPVAVSDDSLAAADKPHSQAMLYVVRGPQIGVGFPLKDTPLSIGRSPKCDIFLNDMTVSRQHAIIEFGKGAYTISDTNSFNGVWINNTSVDTQVLSDGDVVQIGVFCLVYKEE